MASSAAHRVPAASAYRIPSAIVSDRHAATPDAPAADFSPGNATKLSSITTTADWIPASISIRSAASPAIRRASAAQLPARHHQRTAAAIAIYGPSTTTVYDCSLRTLQCFCIPANRISAIIQCFATHWNQWIWCAIFASSATASSTANRRCLWTFATSRIAGTRNASCPATNRAGAACEIRGTARG